MASSPAASMLPLHINDAIPGILSAFALLSLPVNLAPDKTAGMIRFAGEGADFFRSKLPIKEDIMYLPLEGNPLTGFIEIPSLVLTSTWAPLSWISLLST
eukprot:12918780-Prorocentrum_lima.AAC.1